MDDTHFNSHFGHLYFKSRTSPFAFTGAGYPGTNGDCGASLASGASCDVEVQWVPAGTGLQAQTMTINYDDGTGATNFTHGLQGTGANPASLSIQGADPVNFGNVTQGDTQSLILIVENNECLLLLYIFLVIQYMVSQLFFLTI